MVGVGGRSKACDNCYRRRIKCDETKPKCQRCAKAKLECGGYKSLTIIRYEGKGSKSPKSKQNDVQKSSKRGAQEDDSASDTLTKLSPTSDSNFVISFAIKPLPDDVFVNYAISNIVGGRSPHALVSGVQRDLSNKCFMALATFFFGNEHREGAVIKYGLQRYGNALQELNQALGDTAKRKTYDVLESVILMVMMEYLMSNRPDGWIAHSIGLEQLLDACGPHLFAKMPERYIVEISRPGIIFASYVLRKDTILSKEEWKTIPWGLDPGEKKLFEYLMDMMADCAGLIALQDKVTANDTPDAAITAHFLKEQVTSKREKLKEWKRLWDKTEPDCRVEETDVTSAPKSRPKGSETPQIRHTKFIYRSLYHANAVTLYNATVIMFERMLESTANPGVKEIQLTDDRLARGFIAAIDIVRSADYCIDNARGGLGSFYILFPLRMAWTVVFYHDSALRAWLQSTLYRIQFGAAGHWAVAGYLLNLANSREPQPPPESPTTVTAES